MLIQVLSSAHCKLNLNYGGRDIHPQSHLCNTSCTLSVEHVSCTMTCKVSPGRFIPPYRKMQSTRNASDNKSINTHKTIVFYLCNRSTHRVGSDRVHSMETKIYYRMDTQNQDLIYVKAKI